MYWVPIVINFKCGTVSGTTIAIIMNNIDLVCLWVGKVMNIYWSTELAEGNFKTFIQNVP